MTVASVPALDGPKSELFAIPFDSTPAKVELILQECIKHPWWFSAPATDEERALSAAILIHDPYNKVWEVWRGGTFVGLLLLWRIQERVDAVMHFVFFDHNLIGKRSLILSFMGHCYQELGYRRLSVEVPEFKSALLGFARRKLGFRFEGEDVVHKMVIQHGLRLKDPYRANHKEVLSVVMAGAGSRREAAHWDNGQWYDVLCLRQTAEEYARFMETRTCQLVSLPQPSPQSQG